MGGGRRSTSSFSTTTTSSSTPLPSELGEYVAVGADSESDSDLSADSFICGGVSESDSVPCGTYLVVPTAQARPPRRSIQDAKDLIRRYKPGDLIDKVAGTTTDDYVVPQITTLLLVGPRGAGKSTLINSITRVFNQDEDPFAPDRAQVSHNWTETMGSCFLREYTIPRNSSGLCIYDMRGLSTVKDDNWKVLQQCMTKGVRHGQMVIWDSDDSVTRNDIKSMARQGTFGLSKTRTVNFVILVVDGVAVLNSMNGNDKQYIDMLVDTFDYPFLSFRDDKPVIVVTHGDKLSLQQRADVQTGLGELFGITSRQIFEIPGMDDYETTLAILDMLRYCVEHAEQNLPLKQKNVAEMHGRELYAKMAETLLRFDTVIEFAIIFLCILMLLIRLFGKFLP